jgi:hypothetical protein
MMGEVDEISVRLAELERKKHELEDDIKWRAEDLEHEKQELERLAADEDPKSLDMIGAQHIVVETIERVLGDEVMELHRVEEEISHLRGELKRLASTSSEGAPGPSGS